MSSNVQYRTNIIHLKDGRIRIELIKPKVAMITYSEFIRHQLRMKKDILLQDISADRTQQLNAEIFELEEILKYI